MGTHAGVTFMENGKIFHHEYQHYDGYPEYSLTRLREMLRVHNVLVKFFKKADYMTKSEYMKFLEDNELTKKEADKIWPWNYDTMGVDLLAELYKYYEREGRVEAIPFLYGMGTGRVKKYAKGMFMYDFWYVVDFGKRVVHMYATRSFVSEDDVKKFSELQKEKPIPAAIERAINGVNILRLSFKDLEKLDNKTIRDIEKTVYESAEEDKVLMDKKRLNESESKRTVITFKDILNGDYM